MKKFCLVGAGILLMDILYAVTEGVALNLQKTLSK
jgi:hypothetical protein